MKTGSQAPAALLVSSFGVLSSFAAAASRRPRPSTRPFGVVLPPGFVAKKRGPKRCDELLRLSGVIGVTRSHGSLFFGVSRRHLFVSLGESRWPRLKSLRRLLSARPAATS